jgi:predicted dehydrogenase/nucleoside-diphosphate-sugar epimerase
MPQTTRHNTTLRIAVVGCGAVTRHSLLPVLAGHERIRIVGLVDRALARARELGDAYGVSRIHEEVAAIDASDLDGVVLATPPAHHASAAVDLLKRGHHVFVEKPMAISAADADAMVEAADSSRRVLAVGLYRRLLPVTRLLRSLLDSEMLGRPLSVDIEEGGEYSWDLATLSVLTREGGGGGVLIDIGTHLLDQLLYLLPGDASITRYADNARGGIETDCELTLSLATRTGPVPARIELSRTRQLRGSIRVACDHGTFELMRGDFTNLRVHGSRTSVFDTVSATDRPFGLAARWDDEGEINGYKAFREEFDDWLRAIDSERQPQLSGASVLPVVRLIEACYNAPARLDEPWVDGGLAAHADARRAPALVIGRKPRVLVTGAGGFLGCRTVECLHLGGGWDVRAMVRRPGSAARLARFPLDIVLGDVTSAADVAQAVQGCDAIVHCAVGTVWPPEAAFAVTVDGTGRIAEAALSAGVKRLVHISSMAVHGNAVPPRLDESVPLHPGAGADYGRAKYLAEQAVNDAVGRGLNALSLRPARIYGPFSRTFTVRPLQALREGRLQLAGDAESPANMVFVDNVVEAILLALEAPDSERGEAFLINDPDQLSWRAFYEYFAGAHPVRVVARTATPEGDAPGLVRRWAGGMREIALSPELRGLAKKVLWTDPVGTWPRRVWDRSPTLQRRVQSALRIDAAVTYREPPPPDPEIVEFTIDPTLVVSEKARTRLGYRGLVARDEALQLTKAWAEAARLI